MKTPLGLCQDPSCPFNFSTSPEVRLRQVLAVRDAYLPHLRSYLAAMDRSAAYVKPHRIIFASAASSSHYGELQTLVRNVVKLISPRLSNFTFAIYDLGLTLREYMTIEELCNCTVLYFPFSDLPDYFNELYCYAWKPLIINALLKKSEITVWMDTTVRWRSKAPQALDDLFQLLKKRGILLGISDEYPIALRARPTMFDFYGDKACQYHAFPEMWAAFIMLHNEPFVRTALVEPWVACAFGRECMCLPDHYDWLRCYHALPRQEGACHRFDQSSLSIILTRLYLEKSHELKLPDEILEPNHLQQNMWSQDDL